MDEGTKELSRELDAMAGVFTDLGDRLLREAAELKARRSLPPEGLQGNLSAAREGFAKLRGGVVRLARSMDVATPREEALTSLEDLASLLAATAEAEARRAKIEDIRSRAQSLLDRVLSLSHSGSGEFPPLVACQSGARSIREALLSHPPFQLTPEAERLAEGDHPLANLMTLVESREELVDEDWQSLHDSVSDAFGKALAAAAARSRLVLPSENRSDEVASGHRPTKDRQS